MPHSTDRKPRDTGLSCLVLLARFHGRAADVDALRHGLGIAVDAASVDQIVRAGRKLGLKLRCLESSWQRLHRTPLPAIAEHRDGHFFVLAGVSGDKVLVQDTL